MGSENAPASILVEIRATFASCSPTVQIIATNGAGHPHALRIARKQALAMDDLSARRRILRGI
jgi:hypothetical protein